MLTVTEDLVISGDATPDIIKDFNVLLDFWGVKDIETWRNFTLQEKRKYHEAFAYNYEIYITEQKPAPSFDLQKIFKDFTRYVTRVYKSISTELNDIYREENGTDLPVLTDEVRDVMDRMLASEEQIKQSEQIYEMKPMFATKEESGMNDADWKEYTDAIKEYEDLAIDKLTKDSMKQMPWIQRQFLKLKKEKQKQIEKIRKQVEARVTAEVENLPLYKLQKFLKFGKWNDADGNFFGTLDAHKIDIDSFKETIPVNLKSEKQIYQAYQKKLGVGRYGMLGRNGLPVEFLADLFGYETGMDLINSLINLEKIENVINDRVKQIMLEEHSGLLDERQQQLEIHEALHNEARTRFVAIEMKFLTKIMQPVRQQVYAARLVARDILATTKVRDIRPTRFAQAATRARKTITGSFKNR